MIWNLKQRFFPAIDAHGLDVSKHSVPLDGVRGLAILLVLCYDCLKIPNTGDPFSMIIRKVAASGWIGVDLFFVLSGFLITGILLDTRGQKGYWKSFILRRSVRIFPLYYATLLSVFVVMPLLAGFGVISNGWIPLQLRLDQWSYWVYGQNWLFAIRGAWPEERILNHFWSLAVEEQFYLVWPFVVAFFARKSLTRLCVILCAVAVTLRFALLLNGYAGVSTYVMTITRMDSLCMGGLLAIACRNAQWREQWARWMVVSLMTTAIALIGVDIVWPVLQSQSFAAYSIGHTLIGIVFATLIGAVFLVPEQHVLARGFSLKPLLALGKYSYAIYVFHRFVYAAVLKCDWAGYSETTRGWLIFVATLLGSMLVTQLSWKLIEQPFLKLKKYVPRPDEVDTQQRQSKLTVPANLSSADEAESSRLSSDQNSVHQLQS